MAKEKETYNQSKTGICSPEYEIFMDELELYTKPLYAFMKKHQGIVTLGMGSVYVEPEKYIPFVLNIDIFKFEDMLGNVKNKNK